jgi:Ca-activated chloride channel family protein
MSWSRPDLIALAFVLPILLALAIFAYARRRRRVARAMGESHLLRRLGAGDLDRFPTARLLLMMLASAALGVAAAGPRWGSESVETRSRSTSMVLALDVSRSMLVRDVTPNRLERERLLARVLLRELGNDRIGLVAFAGRSYVLSPLTTDHSALELFVDAADPEIVSQGGSSLAAAITQATDLARGDGQSGGDRVVIIATDGEALEEETDVIAAADRSARLGVPVYTVGIGTPAGGPVPDRDPGTGRVFGYKRDIDGQTVISQMNEGLLRDVARRTKGMYVRIDEPGATSRLLAALRGLSRTQSSGGRRVQEKEQFGWFVGAALFLLAADALIARRAARRQLAVASPRIDDTYRAPLREAV